MRRKEKYNLSEVAPKSIFLDGENSYRVLLACFTLPPINLGVYAQKTPAEFFFTCSKLYKLILILSMCLQYKKWEIILINNLIFAVLIFNLLAC
jgi:hypothetical protein